MFRRELLGGDGGTWYQIALPPEIGKGNGVSMVPNERGI